MARACKSATVRNADLTAARVQVSYFPTHVSKRSGPAPRHAVCTSDMSASPMPEALRSFVASSIDCKATRLSTFRRDTMAEQHRVEPSNHVQALELARQRLIREQSPAKTYHRGAAFGHPQLCPRGS